MTDREKVVKGLEVCTQPGSCRECPYWRVYDSTIEQCVKELMLDALELLKEQEMEFEPCYDPATYTYNCGYCGCYFDRCVYNYCPKCGRKVK